MRMGKFHMSHMGPASRTQNITDCKLLMESAMSNQQSTLVDLVRIDRRTLPPVTLGAEHEYRKVQVGCPRRRIPARADVANHVAARDTVAFLQPGSVALQVRVVVAEATAGIELIDGAPARLAEEQFGDRPGIHRVNGRVARRQHVGGFMLMASPSGSALVDISLERLDLHIVERQPQATIAKLRD